MKEFKEPSIEVIELNNDIITSSGSWNTKTENDTF